MMVPGFDISFRPELTNEEYKWCLEQHIPVNKSREFHIYASPRSLRNWVDYPFPFLLADSLIVDESALRNAMWTGREAMDVATAELIMELEPTSDHLREKATIDRERVRALCLNRLCDEKGKDRVFETYSAQNLIDNKRDEFKERLFSISLDDRFSRMAQKETTEMSKKGLLEYDEMVVPV
jgi:hypothetical protein